MESVYNLTDDDIFDLYGREEESFEEFEERMKSNECYCGYYCMNCAGISWNDFM